MKGLNQMYHNTTRRIGGAMQSLYGYNLPVILMLAGISTTARAQTTDSEDSMQVITAKNQFGETIQIVIKDNGIYLLKDLCELQFVRHLRLDDQANLETFGILSLPEINLELNLLSSTSVSSSYFLDYCAEDAETTPDIKDLFDLNVASMVFAGLALGGTALTSSSSGGTSVRGDISGLGDITTPPPTSTAQTITVKGVVYDGPIKGAWVYIDINRDGRPTNDVRNDAPGAGEVIIPGDKYIGVTAEDGSFKYTMTAEEFELYKGLPIIVSLPGGINVNEEQEPVDRGYLSNDPTDDKQLDLKKSITWQTDVTVGSIDENEDIIISPLTHYKAITGLSDEEVQRDLAIELPDGETVNTYNPFKGDGDATGEEAIIIEKAAAIFEVLIESSKTDTSLTKADLKEEVIKEFEEANIDTLPTAMVLDKATDTVSENQEEEKHLATITFTDDDKGNNRVTLSDNVRFEIRDTDNPLVKHLYLKAELGDNLDYESFAEDEDPEHVVTLIGSGGHEETFTLTVTNAAETAPTLAIDNVTRPENVAITAGTTIATAVAKSDLRDEETELAYSLADKADNNDNDLFSINATTGVITLIAALTPDFETKSTYTIKVEATDSSKLKSTATFKLTITDANDPPTAMTLSSPAAMLSENANTATRTELAAITFTDPDTLNANFRDNIPTIPTSSIFEIDGNKLYLKANATLDYETAPTHTITISPPSGSGLANQTFTLTLIDINDNKPELTTAGSFTLQPGQQYSDGTSTGLTLTLEDADTAEPRTPTLSGSDANRFKIVVADPNDTDTTDGKLYNIVVNGTQTFTSGTSIAFNIDYNDGAQSADQITFTFTPQSDTDTSTNDHAPTITTSSTATVTADDTDTTSITSSPTDISISDRDSGTGSSVSLYVSVDTSDGDPADPTASSTLISLDSNTPTQTITSRYGEFIFTLALDGTTIQWHYSALYNAAATQALTVDGTDIAKIIAIDNGDSAVDATNGANRRSSDVISLTATVKPSANAAFGGTDGTALSENNPLSNIVVANFRIVKQDGTVISTENAVDTTTGLTATEVNNITWTLEGEDAALFTITRNANGQAEIGPHTTSHPNGLDFETHSTPLTFRAVATYDNKKYVTHEYVINLVDVNEAPTVTATVAFTTLDVDDTDTTQANGTGTLTISDVDAGDNGGNLVVRSVPRTASDSNPVTATASSGTPIATGSPITIAGKYGTFTITRTATSTNIHTLTWSYTPGDNSQLALNDTVTDSIIISTFDDGDEKGTDQTLTVDITGTNQAPVASTDDNDLTATATLGAITPIDISAIATDIDLGNTLTYTFGDGTLTENGWTISDTNLTPPSDLASGNHDIVIRATDSAGAYIDVTFTVSVSSVPAPTFTSATTPGDSSLNNANPITYDSTNTRIVITEEADTAIAALTPSQRTIATITLDAAATGAALTDADGNSLHADLVALFELTAGTGTGTPRSLMVKSTAAFDYEALATANLLDNNGILTLGITQTTSTGTSPPVSISIEIDNIDDGAATIILRDAAGTDITSSTEIRDDDILTAHITHDPDDPSDTTYTVQWYRSDNADGTNGVIISGATGLTYDLSTHAAANRGKYIYAQIASYDDASGMTHTDIKTDPTAAIIEESPTTARVAVEDTGNPTSTLANVAAGQVGTAVTGTALDRIYTLTDANGVADIPGVAVVHEVMFTDTDDNTTDVTADNIFIMVEDTSDATANSKQWRLYLAPGKELGLGDYSIKIGYKATSQSPTTHIAPSGGFSIDFTTEAIDDTGAITLPGTGNTGDSIAITISTPIADPNGLPSTVDFTSPASIATAGYIQWQHSANGTSGWTNISGETGATYTLKITDQFVRAVITYRDNINTQNTLMTAAIENETYNTDPYAADIFAERTSQTIYKGDYPGTYIERDNILISYERSPNRIDFIQTFIDKFDTAAAAQILENFIIILDAPVTFPNGQVSYSYSIVDSTGANGYRVTLDDPCLCSKTFTLFWKNL